MTNDSRVAEARSTLRVHGGQISSSDHYKHAEHMSNERTHLAYIRTAISLISLGITVNRFSIYLATNNQLPTRSEAIGGRVLHNAASAGFGMVVYGLLLMMIAYWRYRKVDRSIERAEYHSDTPLVVLLTLSVVAGGALSILWMFQ
jgi:putative membrane protein